ncbi:DoxX family protein [Mucilaginibacter celer]|uniref:DoxX family membrane protein n=1 Tax=Mucilaginibacter celer TaxID=2305508 RepID=A0A494VM57_9SPHI|nr:DoxX family protein [Mucilaginibacter celer]AYL95704.1 DoxX family membrane protein [Mucilaginibacter celer]
MSINQKISSFFLRLAIGISYLWEVADRLGLLGINGQPHVGWGDWKHFTAYAKQVMSFLPPALVNPLAAIASIGEGGFGLLLIMGLFTRMAAIGSGVLSLCFAIAMAISFGIESPLGYSVFTLSAASFLLAGLTQYSWSLDNWLASCKINRKLSAYQSAQRNVEREEPYAEFADIDQIRAFVKISYRI